MNNNFLDAAHAAADASRAAARVPIAFYPTANIVFGARRAADAVKGALTNSSRRERRWQLLQILELL